MSRASLLRTLQRVPGALFSESTSSLKATVGLNPNTYFNDAQFSDVNGLSQSFGKQSFGMQYPGAPFSLASQLHTLTKKDDEAQVPFAAQAVPKAPTALAALPPKSVMASKMRRGMASATEEHHLEASQCHPFHILPASPWPFQTCLSILPSLMGLAAYFHAIPNSGYVMGTGISSVIASAIAWWRDCIIESDMGMHTEVQKRNFMNGVWLFIGTEASLFFGLLWSCVHLGMAPNVSLQMQWPPVGIEAIGWEGRALVMSAVLAASYYSANVAMVAKDPRVVMGALGTTVGLGGLFLADQYLEYTTAPFTLTDGPYGTTFYLTTGFHGFHVFIGSVWLLAAMANFARAKKPTVALKSAVLYWHFVDIVWIAVYGIIYAAQL